MKAVIYARVSSREQEQGYSLDAQTQLINNYAQRNGIELVKGKDFVCAESAKEEGRKVFTEMVSFLKTNPSVEAILCEKVDRLLRGNLKDRVEIDDLIKNFGKQILFVKEGIILSQNSKSAEKLQYDLHADLARYYLNNLSDEVKKGMEQMVKQGGYPHKPPFGYLYKEKKIIADPDRSQVVVKIFELYASGSYSIKRLRDEMVEQGLAKKRTGGILGKSDLGAMLRNPFYYGVFRWRDQLWDNQGSYQPLITKDLFDKVQEVLSSQNKPKVRRHNFNFTMLMRCGECGYSITAEKKTKFYPGTKRTATYTYYRCTKPKGIKCSQHYITEEGLEKQLATIVENISLDTKVIESIKAILRQSHDEEQEFHNKSLEAIRSQYDALQSKLDRLLDGYLDGTIAKSAYEEKSVKFQSEKLNLTEAMKKHEEANRTYFEQVENFLEVCHVAPKLFRGSNPKLQRELLQFVVSNLTLKDGKVLPTYKIPFSLLIKHRENGDWQGRKESNPR